VVARRRSAAWSPLENHGGLPGTGKSSWTFSKDRLAAAQSEIDVGNYMGCARKAMWRAPRGEALRLCDFKDMKKASDPTCRGAGRQSVHAG